MSTITKHASGSVSFDGREAVEVYKLRTLISALKLEMKGLKMSRRMSALKVAKSITGLRSNKRQDHIDLLEVMIEEQLESIQIIKESAPAGSSPAADSDAVSAGAPAPVADNSGGGISFASDDGRRLYIAQSMQTAERDGVNKTFASSHTGHHLSCTDSYYANGRKYRRMLMAYAGLNDTTREK